jgi:hypothetical protein
VIDSSGHSRPGRRISSPWRNRHRGYIERLLSRERGTPIDGRLGLYFLRIGRGKEKKRKGKKKLGKKDKEERKGKKAEQSHVYQVIVPDRESLTLVREI